VVEVLAKGQTTIPSEFRGILGAEFPMRVMTPGGFLKEVATKG